MAGAQNFGASSPAASPGSADERVARTPSGQRGRSSTITLSETDRARLLQWSRAASTPQRVASRSRIVLRAGTGATDREIATSLKTTPATVKRWCQRVADEGIEALWHEAGGRGRKPSIPPAVIAAVVAAAARTDSNGRAPNLRRLARDFRISAASICRILKAHRHGYARR